MIKQILTKPKTTNRRPWDYFPDCHICNGIRQGQGATTEDLTKLFEEAKKGKWRKR